MTTMQPIACGLPSGESGSAVQQTFHHLPHATLPTLNHMTNVPEGHSRVDSLFLGSRQRAGTGCHQGSKGLHTAEDTMTDVICRCSSCCIALALTSTHIMHVQILESWCSRQGIKSIICMPILWFVGCSLRMTGLTCWCIALWQGQSRLLRSSGARERGRFTMLVVLASCICLLEFNGWKVRIAESACVCATKRPMRLQQGQ